MGRQERAKGERGVGRLNIDLKIAEDWRSVLVWEVGEGKGSRLSKLPKPFLEVEVICVS